MLASGIALTKRKFFIKIRVIAMSNKEIFKLDTGNWIAEIAVDCGANMYRLLNKTADLELLRSPDDLEDLYKMPEFFGIPVLFLPNRIGGGKFSRHGVDYKFPVNEPDRGNHLHGPLLGKPWRLAESGEDYVEMTIDVAATAGYPHDFTMKMRYTFVDNEVIQDFTIYNRGDLIMPFGLGFHTAFRMTPDAVARVSASKGYWEIDTSCWHPTGNLIPWDDKLPVYTDAAAVSCHCPMTTEIYSGKPLHGAVIEYPSAGYRVFYESDDNYPQWCLFNGGGGNGYFCPEPMTWMIDAPNLNLPDNESGVIDLAPGGIWQAQTKIRLEDI